MPKVIWEEGRVAALSHTCAVKSPLVTMARPKFAPRTERQGALMSKINEKGGLDQYGAERFGRLISATIRKKNGAERFVYFRS